jgi:spore coat protein CotF
MEERYMVNDILQSMKSELATYERIIPETENIALRQTIQQIRNNDEAFQYELFKVAQVKGYYIQSDKATPEEINKVKDQVNT